MKMERDDQEGVTFLRITGEIDHSHLQELQMELKAIAVEQGTHVFLNLSECTRMVSGAIAVLVGWRCENKLADREFGVICPSHPVRNVLQALGLEKDLVRPEGSENDLLTTIRTGT